MKKFVENSTGKNVIDRDTRLGALFIYRRGSLPVGLLTRGARTGGPPPPLRPVFIRFPHTPSPVFRFDCCFFFFSCLLRVWRSPHPTYPPADPPSRTI